ncbi:hypothetical protein [Seonamhaeicola marinus]|uniref:DUF4625 domain-containing protein n=1 Tax=Seonamhaeicola marinus TaxID=1912246 RepID=A0A5D0JBB5_9FLAO|nr:hypothetical protein [Seonamhaeicola marinus]TYA92168.1 hypothetical protein FUA24_01685 [Seonamhaeicola marinus]
MKTLKFLLVFTIVGTLTIGCKPQPLEGDEEPPQIEVISPNNNTHFYTTSSNASPSTVVVNATATDNNAVKLGELIIKDPQGGIHDASLEIDFSSGIISPQIYTSFSADIPGIYTITFVFTDFNDNEARVSRTIEFLQISPGGDDDETAKK